MNSLTVLSKSAPSDRKIASVEEHETHEDTKPELEIAKSNNVADDMIRNLNDTMLDESNLDAKNFSASHEIQETANFEVTAKNDVPINNNLIAMLSGYEVYAQYLSESTSDSSNTVNNENKQSTSNLAGLPLPMLPPGAAIIIGQQQTTINNFAQKIAQQTQSIQEYQAQSSRQDNQIRELTKQLEQLKQEARQSSKSLNKMTSSARLFGTGNNHPQSNKTYKQKNQHEQLKQQADQVSPFSNQKPLSARLFGTNNSSPQLNKYKPITIKNNK